MKFQFSILVSLLIMTGSQVFGADPVNVTTYYESLCRDSIRFFTTQLEPTYELLKNTGIMQVQINAYGKANTYERISGDGYLFTCQHGADECYGNQMLGCGQKYITDHDTYLEFAFCAMGSSSPPYSGSMCSDQVGVPYEPIGTCANTTEGEILLNDVGIQQGQLDPALYYVPWIIINDEFSEENLDAAQADLKGLVCSTYTGAPPPECAT